MKHRTLALAVIAVLTVALAACGDNSVFSDDDATYDTLDPSAPGVTGTVPLPGPISWLEWTPAESPDSATEAQIVSGLEEMGLIMIIPASPSPTGDPARALMNSMSLGWGSGQTFAGSTDLSLELQVADETLVLIRTSGGTVTCTEGGVNVPCCSEAEMVDFRGDAQACTEAGEGYTEVQWEEQGQALEASFWDGLTLEQGLAWLETWTVLP